MERLTENCAISSTKPDSANRQEFLSQVFQSRPISVELDPQQLQMIARAVLGGAENMQDVFPLSPFQESMLLHHLRDKQSDSYVLSTLFELQSRNELEQLVGAVQAVIDRHDALRTAVLWERLPKPMQVVYRAATVTIEPIALDWSQSAVEQLKTRLRPEGVRFDLQQAPLVRLQVAEDRRSARYYALLRVHQIICDHQSLTTVVGEITAGLDDRTPEPLPRLNYGSFITGVLADVQPQESQTFFRSKLESVDEPTAPFGVFDVAEGGRIQEARLALASELAEQVISAAKCSGVSPAILFHSAWALVVAHTSGREDVVFGTVISAERRRNKLDRAAVALSVNTLPLRLRLRDVTTAALLAQTGNELTELSNYVHTPLPLAQRCSGVSAATPLFTALLNYRRNVPSLDSSLTRIGGIATGEAFTVYPVVLIVDELGKGFTLTAQTDPRINPHRLIGYVCAAIQSLVRASEHAQAVQGLSLSILPETEHRQVVELFNATAVAYPQEKLVHGLFEEQVQRAPDAVAVVYEEQSLTYGELNRRANQLAWHLREQGVGPDQLVGICVERSLEMVVGLLGILKAGGAYMPLDPAYPPERLEYMLSDATPRVLLIQERLRERLPQTTAVVIALDHDWSEIAQQYPDNPDAKTLGLSCDQLAYVIYTSGSTGQPKGAMNEHRGVVNRLQWMQDQYRLGGEDRVLQKTPYSFDVSVWEFFWTLMSGARLIVARPEGHKDPSYLRALIEETGVTTLHFVPSMLQSFLDQHRLGECPRLRHIVCSGEELSVALQRKCIKCLPQAELSNLYGPTEAAVDVTAWECNSGDPSSRVPIGRPISNIQMYLLDRHSQPVPIGVSGEIYIAGVGVGRGYLNRPELTAERFVADPFSNDPQSRMYKTGDLGRWRADGTIEYLGRNDHQVKIRGFRIELGEIEAQLLRHPQAKEAVVLAREDEPGKERLVAYVVPQPSNAAIALSVETLRAHLKAVLPEYMVPNAYVMLESFPLTANGKLDRRALPKPGLEAYMSRQYEAPEGKVEETLAGIWREVLHLERVGRQDHFFELGGHSLLAIQITERLRCAGLAAEVHSLLESPTLTGMARAVRQYSLEKAPVPPNLIPPHSELITPQMLTLVDLSAEHIEYIVDMMPGGAQNIQDIYPLAPLQEGILFHHLLKEQGDAYILPILFSLCSRKRLEEFIAALQAVIDRHDILRTAVLWEQLPRPIQVVCRRVTLPVEVLALDSNDDVTSQLMKRMSPVQTRLDVRKAPLMRLGVASDAQGEQWYALLELHHLAHDHESLNIMLAEVMAYIDKRAECLLEPTGYRDHVAQTLLRARMPNAEAFFRERLADVDEPTIPFSCSDVHGDGRRGDNAREILDPTLARRARAQARRLGVSVATLFHVVWAVVAARTSGRDDVVYGTLMSGRMSGSAGSERTLGMFINTVPLRVRLADVGVSELMRKTQRELVELLQYEQTPLAKAQRCSGVSGSVPLFSTLFNYLHGNPDNAAEYPTADGVQILASQEWTNYPIWVIVDDRGEGFRLEVGTDRSIDARRVMRYVTCAVRSLVEALETAPDTPALAVAILPEEERQEVLHSFNATETPYPRDTPIHELFEAQVARTPNAVAMVYEDHSLTYAELNAKANQLAWYLRERQVGPDQLVGICMERSPELVVGLLGILKAGGAYVPLDPSYPDERLQYMLSDAAPRVLLTQAVLRERLPPTDAEVIALDKHWSELTQQSCRDTDARTLGLSSHHLAYVNYTSGSTGKPKGVMVEHRNVVSLVINNSYAPVSPEDCVAHCASPSFDATTWEVWAALLNGARLLVVPQSVVLDPLALNRTLIKHSVTAMWLTVGLFNEYVDSLEGAFSGLRYLLVGGDTLVPSLVARALARRKPPQHVINGYGPTETTTFATTFEIKSVARDALSIPIGRPIGNCCIYILNNDREPAPVGVAGEIYIGGAGVSRGYLNHNDLTEELFVSNPFSSAPDARLYKTGDLGRWRPDGAIEHLGRNDCQVKIRGFRIELGEIEAQLLQYPRVKKAVVLARKEQTAEKRLVAYVVSRDSLNTSDALSVDTLRLHLKAVLPDYMIPSAFIILESLPLTANGKLDRRALPSPGDSDYAKREYEPPHGRIEQVVSELWQELLRIERVGRFDNFFELGGHSLLAMRLISRLHERLGVALQVRDIFELQTLQELAKRVHTDVTAPDTAGTPSLPRDFSRDVNEMSDDEIQTEIIQLRNELLNGGDGTSVYP